MNRIILLYILLFITFGKSVAQELSREVALDVAAQYLLATDNNAVHSRKFLPADLQITQSALNAHIVAEADNGRFVLVCGTDENCRVAGYGNVGSQNVPVSLGNLLRMNPAPVSSVATNVAWAKEDGIELPIMPIVKSVRSQGYPFNRACPYYIYDDGVVSQDRCLVGCVATAAEQLVSHYRYPEYLLDSIAGFESDNNGVIPTIQAGTRIDFDNILDSYIDGNYNDSQADAVANLSYMLGVACRMSWGVGSSAANINRLVEPLHNAFGYKYVRRLASYDYAPRQWYRLLMNELCNNRPILYAGYTSHGGGHAFVMDGMNSDGYFHITWGYGGDYDGYFDLSVFTPQENPLEPTFEGTIWGLNHLQEALFLNPDSVMYETNDTLAMCHRIEVDTVIFNRNPDTNAYVTASINVRNVSDEDVYSPVELFTYTTLDTLGMPADLDYLGLADGIVKAHSDTTLVAYLTFSAIGDRYLGVNLPDSMYLPFDSIQIIKASQPKLDFSIADKSFANDKAEFWLDISNLSPSYWSGRMVTYSLFEGDYTINEGDTRHFTVLNLPPGDNVQDYVAFKNLKPSTKYTFVVRNPWNPALSFQFETPAVTAVHDVLEEEYKDSRKYPEYRLNNRIIIRYDESVGHYRQILSPLR